MHKGLWSGIGASVVLVTAMGCGLSWGPRDVEDWRVVGGTGTGGDTTGGFGDEQVGGSSTGDVCILEEPEECCLEVCAEAVGPAPGGPTTFNCPVAGMPYNCGCDGTDLFDCDDFAHACEEWGRNQGYNICTYVYFWENPNGTQSGHAINIVEFEYPGPNVRYCLIEPQSNTSYGCWVQEPGEPEPPSWVRDAACAAFGGTCTDFEVSCDEGHQGDDGCLVVEAITNVRSVDLVPNPATTKSLFESSAITAGARVEMDEEYADEFGTDDAAVMGDYGDTGGTDDLSALDDGKTPEEALAEGYKKACLAVLTQAFDGGLDPAEAKKRLNKFLSDYFKLADPSSSDDGPPPDHTLDDQKDNPMGPQTESRHRRTRGKPLTENQRQRESRRRAGIVAAVTGRKLAKPASPAGSSGSVAESSAPASPDEARRRRIIDRLKGGKSVHRLPE